MCTVENKETFKTIPGYADYQVSDCGRVKSLKHGRELIMKLSESHRGYLYVHLLMDGKVKTLTVHQLVAMTFLDHKPCGMKSVVDHIDHNKHNNCVENLRVMTNRENCDRSHLDSSSKYNGVTFDRGRNKWSARTSVNGKRIFLGRFDDEHQAHLTVKKYSYDNRL